MRVQDQLDQCLGQNESLLRFIDGERKRYDDLLSAFLNLSQGPEQYQETTPPEPVETPPSVVLDAIAKTFPGDAAIYAANLSYVWSQKHRWEDDAERLAQEILTGETV